MEAIMIENVLQLAKINDNYMMASDRSCREMTQCELIRYIEEHLNLVEIRSTFI